MLAFDEAWRYLNENFHDSKFNGVDWKAVHDTFAPLMSPGRTAGEERRLLSLMIGELNASHLGVSPSGLDTRMVLRGLVLTFDPAEYQSTGKLKIASIVPFGPAALSRITVGKYLLTVDGKSTTGPVNLDYLLDNKIGKAVTLGLSDRADGKNPADVKVTAINSSTERTLVYRSWVNHNRDYVSKISGGRLGYIHIADMSEQALVRLSTDLDARNENYDGVVIDVRNNDGGFVNGYALDVFTRKNYLSLEARGFPRTSGRAALGRRIWGCRRFW